MDVQLTKKGWFLSDEGLTKCKEITEKPDPTANQIITAALNTDLRKIGRKNLPEKINSGQIDDIKGPIVLQLQKIHNVSAPRINQESKGAPRMLRLQLTDGNTTCVAVEFSSISCLHIDLIPGTKLCLNGTVKILKGVLLLEDGDIKNLGGEVEHLKLKWEAMKQADFEKRSKKNQLEGPPPFIEFDASKPIQGKRSTSRSVITFNQQREKPREKNSKEHDEPKKGTQNTQRKDDRKDTANYNKHGKNQSYQPQSRDTNKQPYETKNIDRDTSGNNNRERSYQKQSNEKDMKPPKFEKKLEKNFQKDKQIKDDSIPKKESSDRRKAYDGSGKDKNYKSKYDQNSERTKKNNDDEYYRQKDRAVEKPYKHEEKSGSKDYYKKKSEKNYQDDVSKNKTSYDSKEKGGKYRDEYQNKSQRDDRRYYDQQKSEGKSYKQDRKSDWKAENKYEENYKDDKIKSKDDHKGDRKDDRYSGKYREDYPKKSQQGYKRGDEYKDEGRSYKRDDHRGDYRGDYKKKSDKNYYEDYDYKREEYGRKNNYDQQYKSRDQPYREKRKDFKDDPKVKQDHRDHARKGGSRLDNPRDGEVERNEYHRSSNEKSNKGRGQGRKPDNQRDEAEDKKDLQPGYIKIQQRNAEPSQDFSNKQSMTKVPLDTLFQQNLQIQENGQYSYSQQYPSLGNHQQQPSTEQMQYLQWNLMQQNNYAMMNQYQRPPSVVNPYVNNPCLPNASYPMQGNMSHQQQRYHRPDFRGPTNQYYGD